MRIIRIDWIVSRQKLPPDDKFLTLFEKHLTPTKASARSVDIPADQQAFTRQSDLNTESKIPKKFKLSSDEPLTKVET